MLCWLWHSWGKWEIISEGIISRHSKVQGKMIIQKRTCNDCGFSELDTREATL